MVLGKCAETTNGGDTHLAFSLRVVSQDGSVVRGTLLLFHATSTEYPLMASAATRIHNARAFTANINAQVGDRLILEIGVHGVTPNAENIQHRIGDPSAIEDFALTSGLTTDLCGWWRINTKNLVFGEQRTFSPTLSLSDSFTHAVTPPRDGALFSDGFETGDFANWDSYYGDATVVTAAPYRGNYNAKFVNSTSLCEKDFAATAEVYYRAMCQWSVNPASEGEVLEMLDVWNLVDNRQLAWVGIVNYGGTVYWVLGTLDGAGFYVSAQQTNPSINKYYSIKVRVKCSATVGEFHVFIDEVELTDIAQTSQNTISTTADRVLLGCNWTNMAASVAVQADCAVVADVDIPPEPPVIFERALVGNVGLSSLLSRLFMPNRTFVGNASLSSVSSRFFNGVRSLSGNSSLSSIINRTFMPNRTFTGTIGLSSSFTRIYEAIRTLTSNVSLVSSFVAEVIISVIYRTFEAAIQLSSEITKLSLFARSFIGNSGLSASFARFFSGARSFVGGSTLASDLTRLLTSIKTMVGNVNLSSVFSRFFSGARSIVSDVDLSSVWTRFFNGIRGFIGGSSLSSSLARAHAAIRSFTGNVELSDAWTRFFSGARSFIGNSALSSDAVRAVMAVRSFIGSLSLSSDFTQKIVLWARSLAGNLNMSSSFTRQFNGFRSFIGNTSFSSLLLRQLKWTRDFTVKLSLSTSWNVMNFMKPIIAFLPKSIAAVLEAQLNPVQVDAGLCSEAAVLEKKLNP